MPVNPVLVETTRGDRVESQHRGAFVVIDAKGSIVAQRGDVERPVYPRSAVKLLQALPLVESGAADAFGFGNRELALACGSHSGEPEHIETAKAMLAAAGLGEGDLECGSHWPFIKQSVLIEFAAAGHEPHQLVNNCSGKHAGFLCLAAHLGVEPTGYTSPDHAVMRTLRDTLQEVTGVPHSDDVLGVDGCGIPNWAIPLKAMAAAYARLGSGEGMTAERASAAKRLLAATMAEPWYVAGTRRHDMLLMEAAPHLVHVKTGAEGVYCASLPTLGLGIALKIDDGNTRAAECAVSAIVGKLLENEAVSAMAHRTLRNWNGAVVGEMRAVEAME